MSMRASKEVIITWISRFFCMNGADSNRVTLYKDGGVGHTLCCSVDDFLSDKRAVDADATAIRRRTGTTDSHAAFGEVIDGTKNLIGTNVLSLY